MDRMVCADYPSSTHGKKDRATDLRSACLDFANEAATWPVPFQNAYLISTYFSERSAPEERTLSPISFSCCVAASYCVFKNSV